MPGPKYTNEEKQAYLEVAAELGHSRAMREIGYPKSWNTANQWAQDFGVDVSLDELKSRAAAHRDFYEKEELLTAAQVAIDRAMDFLDKQRDMSADDFKKVMDGLGKAIDKHLLISGKATTRTGHEKDQDQGDPFAEALDAFLTAEQKDSGQSIQDSSERA
ncbi:hypothetical protein AADR41_25390 [Streptomyces sp. CLV115]|uniref:hypothetical protein n=1 Tax=Streptomyces sp. CLV115 TaxID=3138502 RepID=UPI00313E020E